MRQRFEMLVPLDLTVSSNRTAERWKRQKVKNAMRALTRTHAAGLTPCGSASIYVGLVKRTAGRYDPQNTSDTWKGMVDELVDMGVLDEDNYRHVLGPLAYHHGVDRDLPTGYLRAVVTLTDFAPIPLAVEL